MNSHEIGNQVDGLARNDGDVGAEFLDDQTSVPAPLYVANAMTKDIMTLTPHSTFAEIVTLMAKHPCCHFLVMESSRRLVGVISDRDVLRALARTPNWQATYARDLMSCNVVTVKPDTELSVAAGTILEKRINCLPVVDENGDTCGIITSTDLLKCYRKIQERLEKKTELATSVAESLISAGVTLVEKLKR